MHSARRGRVTPCHRRHISKKLGRKLIPARRSAPMVAPPGSAEGVVARRLDDGATMRRAPEIRRRAAKDRWREIRPPVGAAPAGGDNVIPALGLRPASARWPLRAAREELADGDGFGRPPRLGTPVCPWRAGRRKSRTARQELSRKRGPAPTKRRHGAPRGPRALQKRARQNGILVRLAALHPLGLSEGAGREDGVPGAAKEYGRRALARSGQGGL